MNNSKGLAILIHANVRAIQSTRSVIFDMDTHTYCHAWEAARANSIGLHVRHVVDYYQCLLYGWQSGRLDYSKRCREQKIETDPSYACSVLKRLEDHFSTITPVTKRTPVWLIVKGECSDVRSTMERELEFVLSHTIHHHAIMFIMCQFAGWPVEPSFGVAPSTLRHKRLNPSRAK